MHEASEDYANAGAGVDVMDVWHVRVVVIVKYVREMKVDEREGGEKRRKSTNGE